MKLVKIISLIISFCLLGVKYSNASQCVNENDDKFLYKKVEVDGKIIKPVLEAIRDSLIKDFSCDRLGYVRISYNNEEETFDFYPERISSLKNTLVLNRILWGNDSIEKNTSFYLCVIDDVIFQINLEELDKLNINYSIIEGYFEIDFKEFKHPKFKKCSFTKRKTYSKLRPNLITKLVNGELVPQKFNRVNKLPVSKNGNR